MIPTPVLSEEETALLFTIGRAGKLEFSSVFKKERNLVDMLVRLEQRGLVTIKPVHIEMHSDLSDFAQLAYLSPLGRKVIGIIETLLPET